MKEMKKIEFMDEKYTRYMFECFANSTGLNLKGVMPNGKTFMELKGSGTDQGDGSLVSLI